MLASIMLLFSLAPFADEWSKSFDTAGPAALRIKTSDAHIRIETWDRNTIEARVTTRNWKIGDDGIRILDQQNGDLVSLEVKFPRSFFSINFNRRRVDILVRVPKETRLDLRTGDGDIEVTGVKGEIVADTGDGNIRIVGTEGNLRAHTGDGNIDVRDARGKAAVETGDGNIGIENLGGRLRAVTGDGNVRAEGVFEVLEIETGDGRVEASALEGSKMAGQWTLRTGDGSLTLRLPQEFDAEVDVRTGDGHIDFNIPVTISGRTENNKLHGKLNAGGPLITIKTGDGAIRLEKL
jgi:DUF4097 and DUF4098 domain-containing protein YvlB